MKKVIFLIMVVLLATCIVAEPINLNVVEQQRPNVIDNDTLNILNQDKYVHCLIDGYSSVGIQVEDGTYIATIENDSIIKIEKYQDNETKPTTNYTIKTTFDEVVYVYANYRNMDKIDLLRTIIIDKQMPLNVVFRFIEILIQG